MKTGGRQVYYKQKRFIALLSQTFLLMTSLKLMILAIMSHLLKLKI